MQLTPHFSLQELTRSDVAQRHPAILEQQQHPPQSVVDALGYLCETTLEPLRELVGHPLRISSGYRCGPLNERVGGSRYSQHVLGEAADVALDPRWLKTLRGELLQLAVASEIGDVARTWSANGILFAVVADRAAALDVDQVIHEFGPRIGEPAWVHVAASRRQSRRRITFVGGYTGGAYFDATLAEAEERWGRGA